MKEREEGGKKDAKIAFEERYVSACLIDASLGKFGSTRFGLRWE